MWKYCVFLPAEGKQNATFSPNITKPGVRLLEHPWMAPFPFYGGRWISLSFLWTSLPSPLKMLRPNFNSLLSLLVSASVVMAAQKQKLRYTIHSLWNGEPIDHPGMLCCLCQMYRVTYLDGKNLPLTLVCGVPVTAATFCQSRMAEHPKSKSTGGFYHPDRSPCILAKKICHGCIVECLPWRGWIRNSPH